MDVLVIADDLTGANANGALLSAKGFSSATCLGLQEWTPEDFAAYSAITLSVDSRLLHPKEAGKRVQDALRTFAPQRPKIIAKRIDSTLRGNVGAEIESALLGLEEYFQARALAVVVPSYPSSGRLVSGGYLIVHGLPLECSPIAKDSATPLTSSSVLEVIAQQTDWPTGLIDLKTVLAGPKAIRAQCLRLWDQGMRILACDAVINENVTSIAEALADTPFPILAADPGPFTAELALARLGAPKVVKAADALPPARVLTVIGSTSELTRKQIKALRQAHPCRLIRADCLRLLNPAQRAEEIARAINGLMQEGDDASVLCLCTALEAADVFKLEDLAANFSLSPSQASISLNEALLEVAKAALAVKELRIGSLFVSGGEVTVSLFRGLQSKGFSVRSQVLPLAAYGQLIQGLYPDLPVVTKGGFVGDAASLVQCIEYLFARMPGRDILPVS